MGRDPIKLWLDDVRRPPSEEWTWSKSVDEALGLLRNGNVVEASLDHDLFPFERHGIEVICWMEEQDVWPDRIRIHTDNRSASTKMCGLLERNGYQRIPGRPRHFAKREARHMSPAEFMRRHGGGSPNATARLLNAEEKERARCRKEREEVGPIRLWVDDDLEDRKAPEGWVQATTAWDAMAWLDTGNVIALSLDHDLGDDEANGRGIDVVNWLGEQQELRDRPLWPGEGITLHTANAYGRDAMARAIRADAGRRFEVIEERTAGNKPKFKFQAR